MNMNPYEDVLKTHQTFTRQEKTIIFNPTLPIGNDDVHIVKKNFIIDGANAGNNSSTTTSPNHTETIKPIKQIMQPTRETNMP